MVGTAHRPARDENDRCRVRALRARRSLRCRCRAAARSVRCRRSSERERDRRPASPAGRFPGDRRRRADQRSRHPHRRGARAHPRDQRSAHGGSERRIDRERSDERDRFPVQGRRLDIHRSFAHADIRPGAARRGRTARAFACRRARRHRRRSGAGRAAGEHAGRAGPAHSRAVRVPTPACALAALLPQPRRGTPTTARRGPGDRRDAPRAARRQRLYLDLDLRAETTASSSSPAIAKRSPAAAPGCTRCDARLEPPGAPCSSAR